MNDIMEQSADSTEDSCKPSLLLGDFNVNVCQPSHHRTHLDAMCADYNLRLLSTGPTHYAPTGISTTIDLVFASESLVIESCDVLVECLSDHLPILATLQIPKSKCKAEIRLGRNLARIDYNQLRADLDEEGLDNFDSTDTVDGSWEKWTQRVLEVIDRHAPIKQYHPRTKIRNAPWVTPAFLDAVMHRNKCHRKWLKNSTDEMSYDMFKSARATVKRMSRHLKSEHYKQVFSANRSNPRATWKVLNSLTGRGHTKCETCRAACGLGTAIHVSSDRCK